MNARTILLLAWSVGAACSATAQAFSSGSDGSYGPINVTVNTTLDMPPNGIFNATTINVAGGATLTFRRNALNTPVFLLATGNVTIDGDLEVSGKVGTALAGGEGGPGGFDGGNPGSISTPPGAGQGPGAGRGGAYSFNQANSAGAGAYADTTTSVSTNQGSTYGSALLIPLVGGSGGGGAAGTPGWGGGGGGGALLIASNTRIDLGNASAELRASGGNPGSGLLNGGSGGAVRLIAPIITGNGAVLRVSGNGGGGNGRIRIDTLNRSNLALTFFPASVASLGSMMVVFPNPLPRLDIVEAAGTVIAEGSGPVFVNLPFGSAPNRTIKIRARDFNAVVPIGVVLTPDHGTPLVYQSQIDNQTANPAEVSVNVSFPVNVQTAVHAWTR